MKFNSIATQLCNILKKISLINLGVIKLNFGVYWKRIKKWSTKNGDLKNLVQSTPVAIRELKRAQCELEQHLNTVDNKITELQQLLENLVQSTPVALRELRRTQSMLEQRFDDVNNKMDTLHSLNRNLSNQ